MKKNYEKWKTRKIAKILNKKLCNELQQVEIKLTTLKIDKFEKKEKYKV
jgi:hypothetical protein